ncbi:MAG: lysophospholipid acyltransferase family protein [Deltaproteobacteria bacterium]
MLAVTSFGTWALVALSSPLFFLGACAIFLLTLPFDRNRKLLHLYSCFWASSYVALCPLWRSRVTGRKRIPRGASVLVANHASTIDVLVLFGLYRPFKWVSKREMFRVPFIGWNMRLNGYVPLVRGDRDSVTAMLARCRALLAQGVPVMMFPEGTRTKTGELQPFKDGSFDLAHDAQCPVVPIAVHGTGAALPKNGWVLRQRMDAWVEVLEPIPAGRYATAAELRDAARAAIGAALAAGRPPAA